MNKPLLDLFHKRVGQGQPDYSGNVAGDLGQAISLLTNVIATVKNQQLETQQSDPLSGGMPIRGTEVTASLSQAIQICDDALTKITTLQGEQTAEQQSVAPGGY